MKSCVQVFIFILLAGMMLAPFAAGADELAEKGRAVFDKNKAAVVTVEAVISMSFGGEEGEQPAFANGAVIDPMGLTVVSLALLDPVSMADSMGELPGEVTSKVVSLKIIGQNGTEIDAEVVLRDKDFGLAFVRPVEKTKEPLPYIDLNAVGKPQVLDTVVVLTQLSQVARRAHSVFLERVETVVEKPRTYYVLGQHRMEDVLSSPVFTLDGKLVGFGAMRVVKGKHEGASQRDNMLVTVVAAADIKDAAAHVPPVGAKVNEAESKAGTPAPADDAGKDEKKSSNPNEVTLPPEK